MLAVVKHFLEGSIWDHAPGSTFARYATAVYSRSHQQLANTST